MASSTGAIDGPGGASRPVLDVLVFGDEIEDTEFGEALTTLHVTLDRRVGVKRYDTRRFMGDLRKDSGFFLRHRKGLRHR